MIVRRPGNELTEVAGYFGRDVATVATLLGRLGERLQSDTEQVREIERLVKKVESWKRDPNFSLHIPHVYFELVVVSHAGNPAP